MNANVVVAARFFLRDWRRNLFAGFALVLGAGAVVALLGIANSSAQFHVSQIASDDATSPQLTRDIGAWSESSELTSRRLARSAFVIAAGLYTPLDSTAQPLSISAPYDSSSTRVPGLITSASGLRARGAEVVAGGLLEDSPDPSAVMIGASLARRMRVWPGASSSWITVNGVPMSVVGVVQDSGSHSNLTTSLLLSEAAARRLHRLPQSETFVVHVKSELVQRDREILAALFNPNDPGGVTFSETPSLRALRVQFAGIFNQLIALLGALIGVTSLLASLNSMQGLVFEKRKDIGILKALGMRPRDIGAIFLLVAVLLGACAGVAGFVVGSLLSAAIALIAGWPYVTSWLVFAVPLVAVLVTTVAGTVPAVRASRVDAALLVRSV